MDESILQVVTLEGAGYAAVIDFESWRVARLNTSEQCRVESLSRMERHEQTDEVFVLLKGSAVLVIGDGGDALGEVSAHAMQPGTCYNVREGSWHACVVSDDTSVLIVENRNTSAENTAFIDITDDQKNDIATKVRKERAKPEATRA